MGVAAIATRTDGSFGQLKVNIKPVANRKEQLDADEFNRVADAVIELQVAVGKTTGPDASSLEGRIVAAQGAIEDAADAAETAQSAADAAAADAATAQSAADAASSAAAAAQSTADAATSAAAAAQADVDTLEATVAGHTTDIATNATAIAANTAAIALLAPLLLPITDYADSITLVADDKDHLLRMTKATAQSVTVPPNSSVPFAIGAIIHVVQWGDGALTFVEGDGVTIQSFNGSLTGAGKFASPASLIKVDTDTWLLVGGLS